MPGPIRPDDFAEAAIKLGAKVKARRERLGLRQDELGHLIGMDRKAIQNVEYGRSSTKKNGSYGPGNPKLDTIFALARALDVSIAYLTDPEIPLED